MRGLITLGLIGLGAQLIDGSLGMGYGVSSSSLLLAIGIGPAVASATVHLAEVFSSFASGISHARFGNIDRRALLALALPGAAGAFAGAVALSSLATVAARPAVAAFLCLMGLTILCRHVRSRTPGVADTRRELGRGRLAMLGFVAGFFDASGGGGWGPMATGTLMTRPGARARHVIGTVNAAEAAVALAASIGVLIALGWRGLGFRWVGALIAGGLVAAPIAALLVGRLTHAILGSIVGTLLLLLNARTLLAEAGAGAVWIVLALAGVAVVGLLITLRSAWLHWIERASTAQIE